MRHINTREISSTTVFLTLLLVGFLLIPFVSFAQEIEFSRNLRQEMRGDDVYALQVLLNTNPETQVSTEGAGSPGQETYYFGAKTKSAVIRFQEKHSTTVLAPWGLVKGTGYVGQTTRSALSRIQKVVREGGGGTTQLVAGAPTIISIEPNTITKINQDIVITGTGFTSTENTILVSTEKDDKFKNINSTNGTILSATINFSTGEKIKQAIQSAVKSNADYSAIVAAFLKNMQYRGPVSSQYPDGIIKTDRYVPVTFVVKNANGTSNVFKVNVDMKEVLLPSQ